MEKTHCFKNVNDTNVTIPVNREQNKTDPRDSDEIDRAFEDLISQELSFVQKGYKDGLNTGITKHCNEGYKLGLQKGSEVGSKIGSYRGFALIALKHLNEEAILSKLSPKKQKCIKILGKLLKSTEEFPSTNPHATISDKEDQSIDISDILRDMDAKYIWAKNLLEGDEAKKQVVEESKILENRNISQHKTLNW